MSRYLFPKTERSPAVASLFNMMAWEGGRTLHRLDSATIEARLQLIFDTLNSNQSEAADLLPGMGKMFVPMIGMGIPKIADYLATKEGQERFLQLLTLLSWAAGYKAVYQPDMIGCDGFSEV